MGRTTAGASSALSTSYGMQYTVKRTSIRPVSFTSKHTFKLENLYKYRGDIFFKLYPNGSFKAVCGSNSISPSNLYYFPNGTRGANGMPIDSNFNPFSDPYFRPRLQPSAWRYMTNPFDSMGNVSVDDFAGADDTIPYLAPAPICEDDNPMVDYYDYGEIV